MKLLGQHAITRYDKGSLIAVGALDTALSSQLTGQAPVGTHILLTAT
jgi:hypothetical protein